MKRIEEIKQEIFDILNDFVFQKNEFVIRKSIVNRLSEHLEYLRVYDSIYDYQVICDESNNTLATIGKNEILVDIEIAGSKGFGNDYRIHTVILSQPSLIDYSAITRAVVQEKME